MKIFYQIWNFIKKTRSVDRKLKLIVEIINNNNLLTDV